MESSTRKENRPRRSWLFRRQFNWRMLLMRVLVNGLALLVTAFLLPGIYFVNPTLLNVLFLAAILGLLNAFVKPMLQFLTLTFIFASYGLVIVLINTLMLVLLSSLYPELFVVDRLLWAFVGGALLGTISVVLESLFGLSLPIVVADEQPSVETLAPAKRQPAVQGLGERTRSPEALLLEEAAVGAEKRGEPPAADLTPADAPATMPGPVEDAHPEEDVATEEQTRTSSLPEEEGQ